MKDSVYGSKRWTLVEFFGSRIFVCWKRNSDFLTWMKTTSKLINHRNFIWIRSDEQFSHERAAKIGAIKPKIKRNSLHWSICNIKKTLLVKAEKTTGAWLTLYIGLEMPMAKAATLIYNTLSSVQKDFYLYFLYLVDSIQE